MRFPSPIAFLRDRRGNVAMLYALTLPVLMFGAGFAIDYTHAQQVQTKLDAAADAAALAALTPSMMEQTESVAKTAATNMFNAEASTIGSLISSKTVLTVSFSPNDTALSRTITVKYVAANTNIFAGILGYSALQIGGTSTASASLAPNIDFYLLLDNSPSMALPATTAGLSSLQTLTSMQETGGCAFACHQASTGNGDTEGNLCLKGTTYTTPTATYNSTQNALCSSTQGTQLDNYAMARHAGITLRIDELNTGVTTLMSTASSTTASSPQSPPPAYRFAANSLASAYAPSFTKLMSLTSNYVSGWTTASPNFQLMEVYTNNNACSTSACTAGTYSNDTETDFDDAMTSVNTQMPNPGGGTNTAGDTPQGVLFIVTDGVVDEVNGTCSQSLVTTNGINRCQEPINTAMCTTIKNRGIRIAVLYTTYLAVTNDSWYNSHVEPFNVDPVNNSQIRTQLEACASTNLYAEAGVGDDLGAALTNLFNTVTNTAHLTN